MKKILCVLTIIMILLSASVCADDLTVGIGVGDYFEFGTYNNSPILWRCVLTDDVNGVLLLADRAITKKAFDGSGTGGSHARGEERHNGSNYWEDSNIRAWLNSDAPAGEVVWPCGNAPIANNVTYNSYDNEAGFLNGFTEEEKSLIKQVSQKTLLDQFEYEDMTPYGNEPHTNKTSISEVIQNYDTAYGHNVTDGMFLLDIKQINTVYNYKNILGDKYYIAKDSSGAYCRSWLRTARATLVRSNNVRCVEASGNIGNIITRNGDVGVRPAFFLSEDALINEGDGSSSSPYTLSVPVITSGNIQLLATLPQYSVDTTGMIITTVRNYSGQIVSLSFDTVTLSSAEQTPVTVTVSETNFVPGYYFDIYAWDTELTPIINSEHYRFAYVDSAPVLVSAE